MTNIPTVEPTELQLYRVSLHDDARAIVSALRQLSPVEHAKASSCRTQSEHRRFVLAQAGLRAIVGRYLDMSPRAVPLTFDVHGRPLLDPSAQDGVHVGYSVAGELAIVALSGAPLGIDIEQLRAVEGALDIAAAQFADAECARLRSAPNAERDALFLRCLTHKKAVLKATSGGHAMAHFVIGLDVQRQQLGLPHLQRTIQPTSATTSGAITDLLTLQHLSPAPGYTGAVAVLAPQITLRWNS